MNEQTGFVSVAQICAKEEEELQFTRFSRADALALGLLIAENAKEYEQGVAIEITVNGLTVFRYFPEGTMHDNELWLRRKYNTVTLTGKSSLHALADLEVSGETPEDRKLDHKDYAFGGGGFPIILRGTGMVGVAAVSGLTHWQDHVLVSDSIRQFLSE